MSSPVQARLNKKGMDLFGEVFSDGLVPIKGIQTRLADLHGRREFTEIRMVDLNALDATTRENLFRNIAERNKPQKMDPDLWPQFLRNVTDEILKKGLPLREELIDSISIEDPQRWFL